VGASYSNGPCCLSVYPSVCLSVCCVRISPKLSEIDVWLLGNSNRKLGLPDSESANRFAIGSTVLPCWVFLGWHFVHSDKNRPVGLANGSVGTTMGTVAGQLSSRPITDGTLSCLIKLIHRKSVLNILLRIQPKISSSSSSSGLLHPD